MAVSLAVPSFSELSLLVALAGAAWAAPVDGSARGRRRALLCASLAFGGSLASWAEFVRSGGAPAGAGFRTLSALAPGAFAIDALNAPLLPLVALLVLVTVLATMRTKIRRFSFARTLLLEALLLATLGARAGWLLIVLLGLVALPLGRELRVRHRSVRVFALHIGVSMLLLASGWLLVSRGDLPSAWETTGFALVAAGIAIRAGLVPAHCWVVDLFENASLGSCLVSLLPLGSVYAAARLLSPAAPAGILVALTVLALGTAVYSAAMSVVQHDARRLLCHLFLSHASLVLAGIALSTSLGATAGLCLWLSVPLSVMGLGLTLRSLEARTGRLSLREFQGLHAQTPTLAALFLITGLAAVGFPGTVGFFGAEMLTDAAVRVNKLLGVAVVLSAALGSIAVLRAYSMLFLGPRHRATVDLRARRVELAALLALVAVLVGGTLWPQPGIESRRNAAAALLAVRAAGAPPDKAE